MSRIIGHLDMDAFFAAVEERDRPRLKGRPIVVGSDPKNGRGRGVVSTANYKAREVGIHSAMPITRAWELSEKAKKDGKGEVIFISTNGRHYNDVSKKIFDIITRLVPIVEQTSVDEGYLDLSFKGSYSESEKLAKRVKSEIRAKEKLTCSIGIGPNKLIAKIASDFHKPDGLTVVREEEAENFLDPLPIRKIPGVGPKAEALFIQKGIQTVKDLKKFSEKEMKAIIGKWGLSLYKKIRGFDDSPVGDTQETKSVSEQETFEKDTLDPNYIVERMIFLISAVFRRFQKSGFSSFRTVTVTVRFSSFETRNRSHTFIKPINDLIMFEFEAQKLLYPFFDRRENPSRKPIRLVGVRIEKLKWYT